MSIGSVFPVHLGSWGWGGWENKCAFNLSRVTVIRHTIGKPQDCTTVGDGFG